MSDDPRGWLHAAPDLAAIAAGVVAVVIRTSSSDGPRSWRVVLADSCATMALGYAVYRGALAAAGDPNLAFATASFCACMGWEWVRRKLGPWAERQGRK